MHIVGMVMYLDWVKKTYATWANGLIDRGRQPSSRGRLNVLPVGLTDVCWQERNGEPQKWSGSPSGHSFAQCVLLVLVFLLWTATRPSFQPVPVFLFFFPPLVLTLLTKQTSFILPGCFPLWLWVLGFSIRRNDLMDFFSLEIWAFSAALSLCQFPIPVSLPFQT